MDTGSALTCPHPDCGAVVRSGAKFCARCGRSVVEPPAAPPPEPPPSYPKPAAAPPSPAKAAAPPLAGIPMHLVAGAIATCILLGLGWMFFGRQKEFPVHPMPAVSSNAPVAAALTPPPRPSGLVRLTTDPAREVGPVWTVDGNLLFQSNRRSTRANGNDIWEMRPDGTGQREAVRVEVSTPPEWGDSGLGPGVAVLGPSGDLAVYETQQYHEILRVATSKAGTYTIIRTVVDGADGWFVPLLKIPGGESASNIVYSAATGMAAWVANNSGGVQIRTAPLAGMDGQSSAAHGVQLAALPPGGVIRGMSYSPDGSRLIAAMCWANCGSGKGADLYLLGAANGERLGRLTSSGEGGTENSSPAWSPGGAWIAFTSTTAGQQGLWLVSSNGSNPRPIDTGGMPGYGPAWSPDETRLAFVGVSGENHDIWLAGNLPPQGPIAASPPAPPAETKPSFDCANARTPAEKTICGDVSLASLERRMVAAYGQLLRQAPPGQAPAFRRQHLEWFKDYARTCNAKFDEETRRSCIVQYLSGRAQDLEARIRR